MLIQILAPTSNLPEGVNILTSGGLKADHQLRLTWHRGTYGSRWGTRLIRGILLHRMVYRVVHAYG